MPAGIPHHMNDEEIERYSMGGISEDEAASFEEHLLICESCQGRVAESDAYVAAMKAAGTEVRRNPQKRKAPSVLFFRATSLSLAAGFVLTLGVSLMRTHHRSPAAAPFSVSLEATRGAAVLAKAPARQPLTLTLDLRGMPELATYRLSAVDRFGRVVWQGSGDARDWKAGATIPPLKQGVYFVRVYGTSGELLREYGLEVEGR